MPESPNEPEPGEEIIIRNGLLKKWWSVWIRYYDVILLGTEEKPLLKVRATWLLGSAVGVIVIAAFAIGKSL